jgi:hypothetical protein
MVTLITVTPRGELYHQIMYRIRKDKDGATLVCRTCTHTERVQGFNRNLGNQRTLAAHAMLEHFHEERSCETQVCARAMVMERENVPRYGSRTW